jgi:predicted transcriptional regulator
MFKNFESVKALKTLIKLSAVALTSPATVAVASSLYPDNPIVRGVVSVSALILIEGCLLLGWEMLDQQGKSATMAQRWLYAGLAWVAYFSLFVIALNHNEGIAGLTFRLTLGVMLIYASVEAGLLAGVRREGQADRDILTDWQVKRYARKLAVKSAMADLDLTFAMRKLDREAQEKVYILQKERDTQQQIQSVQSDSPVDRPERVEKPKSDTPTLDHANRKRRQSKRAAMNKLSQILTANPSASLTDVARRIGRSRQTVYDYLDEMEQTGKLHRNGDGVKMIE